MTPVPLLAPADSPAPEGHVIPYRRGYFQTQLVKGSVMVGIFIWRGFGKDPVTGEILERGWQWRAALDGVEVHPWRVWPECSGDEITEAEYRYLLAQRQHAQQYQPDSPFANPRKKVDWLTVRHDFSDLKGPQQ